MVDVVVGDTVMVDPEGSVEMVEATVRAVRTDQVVPRSSDADLLRRRQLDALAQLATPELP